MYVKILVEWYSDMINKYTPIWSGCSVSHWQGCKIKNIVAGGPCSEGPRVEVCPWILTRILKPSCFLYKFSVLINENNFKTHSHIFFLSRNRNPSVYVAKMKAVVIYSKCSFSLALVSFSICLPLSSTTVVPESTGLVWLSPSLQAAPAGTVSRTFSFCKTETL